MPATRIFPRQAIAAALALLLVPASALCFTFGDLNYDFQDGSDTEVYVSGLANSSATHITIPSTVPYNSQTYRVTSIRNYAFEDCSGLASVTIPDSVTSIGQDAFSGCASALYDTNSIPGVRLVDGWVVGNLSPSDDLDLTGIRGIGDYAFYYCRGLTSVTIPDSVTSIGSYAFLDCRGLTSVTIPDSVTSIGYGAFSGCSGLASVTIPDSVTSIESEAFTGCASALYDTNSIPGVRLVDGWAVGTLSASGDLDLTGIRGIGDSAFYNCSGLTSVSMGDSVTSIGDVAFYNCSGLTSVTMGDSVTSIGGGAFYGCSGLTSVSMGDSVTSIGDVAFYNCSGLTSVTIPTSVTNIGDEAFAECRGLTSVSILGNVMNDWIDENLDIHPPFRDCTNLTTLVLGKKMTRIGRHMFFYCSGLTSVSIPNSVTNIGGHAFEGCRGLTNVTILGNVANDYDMRSSPFRDCPNLATLVLGEKMTKIGDYMFSGCSGLTSVTMGDGVMSIGEYAFYGCSGLTSVTIPDSVTSIGNNAFSGCSGLTRVHIRDLVAWCGMEFGDNPLSYAHHLYLNGREVIDLTIPSSVTSIGGSAFSGCSSLTSVTIPDSVTSIGAGAFSGCSGLTSVTIPEGVMSIGNGAFSGCSGLTSVTIPDSVESLSTTAFDGCGRLWTAWYRTLANLSATGGGSSGGSSGGGSGGSGKTVSLTVTNVVVHYVTQSVPSGAVTPSTNSTGIVNIIADVTATKAIAITEDWAKQYPGFEAAFGSDFSAALTKETGKRDGAGNPMFVWQDFVAGTDPTDPTSVFTATLAFDAATGDPLISWSPELPPAETAKRKYTVSAKKRMTDPDWIPVDGDTIADYNFFRVTVEMR